MPFTIQGTGPSAYQEPTNGNGNVTYEQFLAQNPAIGYLKIQASRAQKAIPISNLRIVVMQEFNGLQVLFFDGKTDANGIISSIELPAPPLAGSLDPQSAKSGAVYQVYATHPDFEPAHYQIEMFEGVTAILPVTPQLAREV